MERQEYSLIAKVSSENRSLLSDSIKRLRFDIQALNSEATEWVKSSIRRVLRNEHDALQELSNLTAACINTIDSKLANCIDTTIEGFDHNQKATIKHHAELLLQHLSNGGSLGWWIVRPKVVREALKCLDCVRVDGQACLQEDILHKLIDWLDVDKLVICHLQRGRTT